MLKSLTKLAAGALIAVASPAIAQQVSTTTTVSPPGETANHTRAEHATVTRHTTRVVTKRTVHTESHGLAPVRHHYRPRHRYHAAHRATVTHRASVSHTETTPSGRTNTTTTSSTVAQTPR